jgi:D-beta-D-heptose 7-phosphate kinase / D-beta-D-heptose 1-phosphate adenosyltransferase
MTSGATTRIVVVGDTLLDCDIDGTSDRLAPDAPVPVVERHGERWRAGGAALAASLLARRRDVAVTLVSAVGGGPAGERVRALLDDAGVALLGLDMDGTTPEKVRVLVEGRPVVRLDQGGGTVRGRASDEMLVACDAADGVLVADYGSGVVRPSRLAPLLVAAGPVPIVWDPHPRGCAPSDGTWLATPNLREAMGAADVAAAPDDVLTGAACAEALLDRWRARGVAVTLGAAGAVLATNRGSPMVVPADAARSGDACGAGDCFAGAATLALARGSVLSEAVQRAVEAATRYVGEAGGGALEPGSRGTSRPGSSRRVVATSGCFDLLHAGHVGMLEDARRLGDHLVVCLNSDASVRRLKGPGRPLQPAEERAAVLRALRCVDEVVVFDEDTPVEVLGRIRPQLFVKGGDYFAGHHPEIDALARWGGRAVVVPYRAGRSTTRLIEEVRHG